MDAPLPVDLRLLASFVVLAEELHFTRAAERLHLAQPALSRQISRLEQQLGTVLFTRRPQPVALTAAGTALYERARPALGELHAAVDAARVAGGRARGTVRLGHLSSFGPRVVPALATALAGGRTPAVELQAREASVEEQLEGLRDGTLDVGLFYRDRDLPLEHPGLHLVDLASGPHYVALPPGHLRAHEREVPLEAFADERWVLPRGTDVPGYQEAMFRAVCARHGFVPREGQHANSIETMLGMVAAGLGVAPAPWTVLLRPPPELVFTRTPGESFDVVAATAAPGAAQAFVAVARDVLAGLVLSAAPTAR